MINKYPYTDFHELNLDWFLRQFKQLKTEWTALAADNAEFKATMTQKFDTLDHTVQTFTDFVTNYFDNLDVQQEINNKLDQMVLDGTLGDLLQPYVDTEIPAAVTAWLDANVDPVGSAVTIDKTLTISGSAGDAKIIGQFREGVNSGYNGMTWSPSLVSNSYIKADGTGVGSSTKYVRTNILSGSSIGRVSVECTNPAYEISVVYYDADSGVDVTSPGTHFLGTSTYYPGPHYIPTAAVGFGTNVRRVDGVALTAADRTAIAASLMQYRATDPPLTKYGKPADAKVVGDSLLNTEIKLYPCMFVGNTWIDASNTSSTNNAAVATSRNITLRGKGYIHFTSSDPNVVMSLRRYGTSSFAYSNSADFMYDGANSFYMNIKKVDGTQFSLTDFAAVHLYASKQVADQFAQDNYYNISNTMRFPNVSDEPAIVAYGMYQTTGLMGFCQRSQPARRITVRPCITPSDCVLLCGKYNTNNKLKVVVSGTLYTVVQGSSLSIPANTPFIIGWENDTSDSNNTMTQASICIVKGTSVQNSVRLNQWLNDKTVQQWSVNSACLVDDNWIFTVSDDSRMLYSVYDISQGIYTTSNAILPTAAGHANNCCYHNGYIYISDWTDGKIIHVFELNTGNGVLTFVKDITLPDQGFGSVEYVVRSNEDEIFFLGWASGNSGTNPNYLVYGLFIKTSGGYELSWMKKARRPTVLQGFTVAGSYMYYITISGGVTTAIWKLDINTGLATSYSVDGTLASHEGEAIFPIYDGSDANFYVVDVDGRLYFYSIRQ